jgi:16S rRNA (cytosine1402-N4)-methyltransferase
MSAEPTPFVHDPVMADEITAAFSAVPPGVVVDATLGGGGHAERLLATYPHLRVLGLDRDRAALAAAQQRLAPYGDRLLTVHTRFDHLEDAMSATSVTELSGALFDLGVSSPQLDQAERGFSYRHDAPLDMRMDRTQEWGAHDVVNGYAEDRLAEVIRRYGDERFASRIASAIVAARPLQSTAELAAVVVSAIPAPARRTGGHPAKRTFQAIRIEVNGELDVIEPALESAIDRTVPGGSIAVLSYHSGEDRRVKAVFRQAATGGCTCPPELPCVCDAVQTVRLVRTAAKRPTPAEAERNPRARSARLRVVERIRDRPSREAGAR